MNITSEIDIGTPVGSQPLTFYGPAGTWTATGFNSSTACAVKQGNNTRIIGEGFQNPWIIHGGVNGNNFGSVYCTTGGGGSYYLAENVQVYNPNGASTTNGAAYIVNVVDGSLWKNFSVFSYGGIGLHLSGWCCTAGFLNLTVASNWVSGAIPLQIDGGTSVVFTNASIGHPGAGQPNVKIIGPNSITTWAGLLYMESSNSDTTTPLIQITDSGNGSTFTAETVLSYPTVLSSTAYVLQNTGTSDVAIQSLQRRGNSSGTNGINEVGLGFTVPVNALGNILNYSNHGSFAVNGVFQTNLKVGGGALITSSGSGGTLATIAGTETLTNKTLTSPTVNHLTNGTGVQIFNTTTTCTTAASAGATCTTAAITLPVAEADTSYRIACTGKGPKNVPTVVATTNSSATQFTITIAAITAAAATYSSYDCVAGHN
jgi:hypothetical protein